jgi:hypothetical protein
MEMNANVGVKPHALICVQELPPLAEALSSDGDNSDSAVCPLGATRMT